MRNKKHMANKIHNRHEKTKQKTMNRIRFIYTESEYFVVLLLIATSSLAPCSISSIYLLSMAESEHMREFELFLFHISIRTT